MQNRVLGDDKRVRIDEYRAADEAAVGRRAEPTQVGEHGAVNIGRLKVEVDLQIIGRRTGRNVAAHIGADFIGGASVVVIAEIIDRAVEGEAAVDAGADLQRISVVDDDAGQVVAERWVIDPAGVVAVQITDDRSTSRINGHGDVMQPGDAGQIKIRRRRTAAAITNPGLHNARSNNQAPACKAGIQVALAGDDLGRRGAAEIDPGLDREGAGPRMQGGMVGDVDDIIDAIELHRLSAGHGGNHRRVVDRRYVDGDRLRRRQAGRVGDGNVEAVGAREIGLRCVGIDARRIDGDLAAVGRCRIGKRGKGCRVAVDIGCFNLAGEGRILIRAYRKREQDLRRIRRRCDKRRAVNHTAAVATRYRGNIRSAAGLIQREVTNQGRIQARVDRYVLVAGNLRRGPRRVINSNIGDLTQILLVAIDRLADLGLRCDRDKARRTEGLRRTFGNAVDEELKVIARLAQRDMAPCAVGNDGAGGNCRNARGVEFNIAGRADLEGAAIAVGARILADGENRLMGARRRGIDPGLPGEVRAGAQKPGDVAQDNGIAAIETQRRRRAKHDRRVVDRIDGDGDGLGRRRAGGVSDGDGEGVGTVEVGVRGVGVAAVGVDHRRAVGRLTGVGDGEGDRLALNVSGGELAFENRVLGGLGGVGEDRGRAGDVGRITGCRAVIGAGGVGDRRRDAGAGVVHAIVGDQAGRCRIDEAVHIGGDFGFRAGRAPDPRIGNIALEIIRGAVEKTADLDGVGAGLAQRRIGDGRRGDRLAVQEHRKLGGAVAQIVVADGGMIPGVAGEDAAVDGREAGAGPVAHEIIQMAVALDLERELGGAVEEVAGDGLRRQQRLEQAVRRIGVGLEPGFDGEVAAERGDTGIDVITDTVEGQRRGDVRAERQR